MDFNRMKRKECAKGIIHEANVVAEDWDTTPMERAAILAVARDEINVLIEALERNYVHE